MEHKIENLQDKTTFTLVLVILLAGVLAGIFINGWYDQHQRQKCNEAFHSGEQTDGHLPTDLTISNVSFSNDGQPSSWSDGYTELKNELQKTNSQYNKIQDLLSCYFDQ